MDWVDDVYLTTPLGTNPASGNMIDSHTRASIPVSGIDKGSAYVQLFTFKSADGKSPSFSEVIPIGDSARLPDPPIDFALPSSLMIAMSSTQTSPRIVPCQTGRQALARQSSLDDLLGSIAKIAVPLVAGLLKGGTSSPAPMAGVAPSPAPIPGSGAVTGPTPSAGGSGEDLMRLLGSLITQLTAGAGGMSQSQSTWRGANNQNRFSGAQSVEISHAFFAPALLAFLGPLLDGVVKVLPGVIGPIAQNAPQFLHEINQQLPMLINAINQKQMQAKAADNKLATDTLAQVNQRLIAQEFLRNQQSDGAGVIDPAALVQLLQLLQQASTPIAVAPVPSNSAVPVAPVAPAAAQSPPVLTQSFALDSGGSASPSQRAVLTFNEGAPLPWNASEYVLYARDRGVQLRLRLMVAPPVPVTALPKAILKVVLKDGGNKSPLLEKTVKLKGVAANSDISITIAAEEIAKVAVNRPITAYAELRWLSGPSNRESLAVGTTEFVLVDKCFVKQQGPAVSPEREPRDMNRFRSFWNKLWESPVIDEAGSRRDRPSQVLWDLDVNAKYSVLLSADHDSNGMMETRLLKEKTDPDDISARTSGRLKGGVELSIAALAQLLPLWDDAPTLAPEQVEALRVKPVEFANASELIYNVKLNGKAGQRGIVWVLPVFRLFEFTLGRVRDVDETGCVTGVVDETVRFPLPVAARLIGVKSENQEL